MKYHNLNPAYPANFYMAIFGEPTDNTPMPADAEETIKRVMETLPSQEAEILMFMFMYDADFDEIGGKFGLTRERARQIVMKAERKLRHPSRAKILLYGWEGYLNKTVAANNEKESKYIERISELETLLQNQDDEIAEYQAKVTDLIKKVEPSQETLAMDIDAVGLSLRAFYCLNRAGINTIKDLLDAGDLSGVKNLGSYDAEKVQSKLIAFMIAKRCQ